MKKFFILLLLLIIIAGAVFFVGWVQFRIPAGSYGVYVTKMHGWNPDVLIPGRFAWTWESLIPSNLRLFRFTVEPKGETIKLEGVLPSGDIYSSFAVGKPDFSYNVTYTISASVRPESLPGIAESQKIESQESLDAWLESNIRSAGEALRGIVLARASEPDWISGLIAGDPTLSKDLAASVGAAVPDLNIKTVSIQSVKVPDLDLYQDAKAKYRAFLAATNTSLSQSLEKEASARAQNELRIESLERYGQLITKYPKLIEFLAVENKTDAALLEALGKRPE